MPQDLTRVLSQPVRQRLLCCGQAPARDGGRSLPPGADRDHPRPWRRGRDSRARQRRRHRARDSATSCSSRSSPPSRPARGPGSACRFAMTSSPSSMAARSPSTAGSASTPNSPSACRGTPRPTLASRHRCRRLIDPDLGCSSRADGLMLDCPIVISPSSCRRKPVSTAGMDSDLRRDDDEEDAANLGQDSRWVA